ncbi:hypothetical protein DICVIV_06858 [Dictyocaulus viviparus]|uniref:Phosphoglycerate mutase family protein n=1 Tax=Dictyocaulus viviparus TaxID=29172 RepID=A0A0D8XTF8_DICVI|nr:hypothetical protein DICVIV_06858 [Dictyocaulus viviparus]
MSDRVSSQRQLMHLGDRYVPKIMKEDYSEYTSETGSYSCPSNEDRSDKIKKGQPQMYNIRPNVMMIMRHTEQLDDYFPNWINKCRNGYKAYDLNMPKVLPIKRPLNTYRYDPPITNTGDLLARIIAKGIFSTSYVPHLIYSSPALKCLQTANAIRLVCKCEALIRVEPGLFENLSLYPNGLPHFPTPEQRAQFCVDESYRPHMRITDLEKIRRETIPDYNIRIKNTLLRITKLHQVSPTIKDQIVLSNLEGERLDGGYLAKKSRKTSEHDLSWVIRKIPVGSLLVLERVQIVGHASTVDMAAGYLAKKSRKTSEHDLSWVIRKIPVGSLLVLERVQGRRGWTPNLYAIPPVTYTGVTTHFDSAFVLRDALEVKR